MSTAGNVRTEGVATWDGSAWSAMDGNVQAPSATVFSDFEVYDGALYGSGSLFLASGGFSSLARWDGASWQAVAAGAPQVEAHPRHGSGGGSLYLCGFFTSYEGVQASNIARWDGTGWSALGTGLTGTSVRAEDMATFPAGGSTLYVVGTFSTAGGVTANGVARWNGTQWSAAGSGLSGSPALPERCIVADLGSGPRLIVVGTFETAGSAAANGVAQWDGAHWDPIGVSPGHGFSDVSFANDGAGPTIYVSGFHTQPQGFPGNVAMFRGGVWSPLGLGVDRSAQAILAADLDGPGAKPPTVFATGNFALAGGAPSKNFAAWTCPAPACYADCNGDGALNLADFGCFQTKFATGDSYADCNGDGMRNLADFGCFQTKFALGCP
jgi:hypothetical protein